MNILTWLQGKKTHLTMLAGLAGLGLTLAGVAIPPIVFPALGFLGLGFLRTGVQKGIDAAKQNQ